ncbi:glycine rich domain-containing protein [Brevibacillus laterosporus]|uniref:glycine rich domain-containing protein n=1 Tax=Brevibacillus laterosporus TaxID=1465 RepID=UPI00130DC5C0|nr:glycine rich domain-containing protein [Brevibacillus laterosporus]
MTKGKIGKDAQGRTTYTFEYTGKPEAFMVPPNVNKILIECWGAQGGLGYRTPGGKGGYAKGSLGVSSGEVLQVNVGGMGKQPAGGWNGGGSGKGREDWNSGGGGGATDVRKSGVNLEHRVIVAGGGGGTFYNREDENISILVGGYGGGLEGGQGERNKPDPSYAKGGTQTAGGALDGQIGIGGDATTPGIYMGGGGGGGYYGGGSGAGPYDASVYGKTGAGGGGSSYHGNLANSSTTAGVREGNGLVVITILNEPPKFTLTSPSDNQTLTENATLNIQGTASDTDKDNVVTIKYRINNGTTRALQSGVSNGSTPISFAKTLTFRAKRLYDGTTDLTGSNLAENTDHTLTIWAEDDQGGKSTEITLKFRAVHNRPPVINGQNVDLGVLSTILSKTYTVTEPEGDAFTITEKINGKVIRTFAGTDSKENTATIPLDTWLRLSLTAVHTLTIEATDSKGMTSTRSYTFRRSADKIAFALRNPFGTDIAAKRILVTIDATIPAGADYKAEVCNNAFDELPTWEDASNHVKFNRGFIFTNKEKTAKKWGVSVRFSFTKGTATEPVIVRGFGGAFD